MQNFSHLVQGEHFQNGDRIKGGAIDKMCVFNGKLVICRKR